MQQPLISRRFLVALIVAALLLPITLCVILGVASLLGAMGDAAGEGVLQRIALAGGILWGIDLICLIVVLAIASLRTFDDSDPSQ